MIADGGAVVNYFDVRWVDGYGHVSDAGGSLAVAIEEVCKTVEARGDSATLATRELGSGADRRAVGVLRLDVVTSSGPRTLQYVHAAALPPGHRLDDAAWQRLVTRRYGDDPAARIRAAYEAMAATTKDAGRELLAPFMISVADVADLADLAAELDDAAPPVPPASAPAPPPPVASAPTHKTARELGAGAIRDQRKLGGPPPGAGAALIKADDHQVDVRWGARLARGAALALVVGAAAVIAIVALRRPDRVHDPIPSPALTALQAEVDALRADRDQARAELTVRAAELQRCQDNLASGVEGELRRRLDQALDDAAGLKTERDRLKLGLDAAQRDGKLARAALDQATARAADQDSRYGLLHDAAVKLCRKLGPARCPPEALPR